MAVLGILLCEILELEFAHLLGTESGIGRITVLENTRSARFLQALQFRSIRNVRKIADLNAFVPLPGHELEVLVRVLELGLHNRKRLLQEGLLEAAKEMAPHVDALLLGYGLCGNALEKPDELLSDVGARIFMPMDEDHPVDDCVGLLIGGRDLYYGEQCKVAGTFFMIPGWTYHWSRMFDQDFGRLSIDMARRLFAHYERSLLILTPIMPEGEMRHNTEGFDRLFGFRVETRPGTLRILAEAWQAATGFLKTKPDRAGFHGMRDAGVGNNSSIRGTCF